MNEILFILSIFSIFIIVVLLEKVFPKTGLVIWGCFAIIIANILVLKQVNIFGIATTLGNVMFASIFLANDIIVEKYGLKESQKAINLSMVFLILFIFGMQFALLYIPNSFDFVQDKMKYVFQFSFRTSIASILLFYLSNLLNVYIIDKMKSKYKLFLRNNISTIIANCFENFLFVFLAFYGILDTKELIIIAYSTTIFEFAIALLDTPFIYWALKKR